MMFASYVQHQLDQKFRMRIPPKYRTQLGDGQVVILASPAGCLNLYSADEYAKFVAILDSIPQSDLKAQSIKRSLLMSVFFPTEDNQGRFVLPQHLRDFAKMEKEIVFVGMGNIIEIWAKEQLDAETGGALSPMSLQEGVEALAKYGY